MKLLLDSHVIIWCANDEPSLSAQARKAITDTDNELFVSIAGIWELYIKSRKSERLKLQVDLREILDDAEYNVLGITIDDAELASALPRHHGDPFDRMMIAQAMQRNMVLVSGDSLMLQYNVPLIKA